VRAATRNFSQEILGIFPKVIFCVRVFEIFCCVGGRTVQIRTVCIVEKWARFFRQEARESRQLVSVCHWKTIVQKRSYIIIFCSIFRVDLE
jgi:hypothetical protein